MINQDTEKLKVKLKELIRYFGLNELYHSGKRLVGSCPIHDGDNPSAFNINVAEGDKYYGSWFCNTQKCHEKYGGTPFGLVYGLLSKEGVTRAGILDFISSFVDGVSLADPPPQDKVLDFLSREKVKNKYFMSKDSVSKRLQIPSRYYLDRGFSEEILTEYGVGDCFDRSKPMYNRAVFPIIDEDNTFVIGCTGRSLNGDKRKWIFNKGFNAGSYFYNYWNLQPTGSVILVEGQGDLLKLKMGGINNVLGLFGSNLTDYQEFLLQKLPSLDTIYLGMDNDEAGLKCRNKIKRNLGNLFKVVDLEFPGHDLGEMSTEQIQFTLRGQM
ncbi:MAG: toprim domain-containing protein [Nitrososphaerales archaeon]